MSARSKSRFSLTSPLPVLAATCVFFSLLVQDTVSTAPAETMKVGRTLYDSLDDTVDIINADGTKTVGAIPSYPGKAVTKAILGGNSEDVKRLLAAGEPVTYREPETNLTPLHIAAERGNTRIVTLLLETAAKRFQKQVEESLFPTKEVNVFDIDARATMPATPPLEGVTALYLASINGHSKVVNVLLKNGAAVDAMDSVHNVTSLFVAAYRGFLPVVELLLEYKANPNHTGKASSILTGCAGEGHADVIKALIQGGADPNLSVPSVQQDGSIAYFSPIALAARYGHLEAVRILAQAGSTDTGAAADAAFALGSHAKMGADPNRRYAEIAAELVLDYNAQAGDWKQGILYTVIGANNLAIKKANAIKLLKKVMRQRRAGKTEYDPDEPDDEEEGEGAAMSPATTKVDESSNNNSKKGNAGSAKSTTNAGADASITTSPPTTSTTSSTPTLNNDNNNNKEPELEGSNPADNLKRKKLLQGGLTKWQIQELSRNLVHGVKTQDVNYVRTLLQRDAPTDYFDDDGFTALHWAVENDASGLVEALLDAGAPVNAAGTITTTPHEAEEGEPTVITNVTPLFMASVKGNEEIVQMLLDRGADVNIALAGGDDSSPLSAAAFAGYLHIVKLLIAKGANVQYHGQRTSVLIQASTGGDVSVMRALVNAGADPNESVVYMHNEGGVEMTFSPLKAAALHGRLGAVRFLVARGAKDLGPAADAAFEGGYAAHTNPKVDQHAEIAVELVQKGAKDAGPWRKDVLSIIKDSGVKEAIKVVRDMCIHRQANKGTKFPPVTNRQDQIEQQQQQAEADAKVTQQGEGGGKKKTGKAPDLPTFTMETLPPKETNKKKKSNSMEL